MDQMRKFFMRNIKGTLMREDNELVYFEVKNKELVKFDVINDDIKLYPYHFTIRPMNAVIIDQFFKDRVIEFGCMQLKEYLDYLNLKYYDYEEIVKRNNGWNMVDLWWVKFDGIGAKNWKEVQTQKYPIYSEGVLEDYLNS